MKERDGHINKDTLLAGTRPLSMTKVGALALEYIQSSTCKSTPTGK
jgi:hypothetical protein